MELAPTLDFFLKFSDLKFLELDVFSKKFVEWSKIIEVKLS
jgi:hypothetical protein